MKSDIILQKKNLTLFDLETTKTPDAIEIIIGYLLALVGKYSNHEFYNTSDSTCEIFINHYIRY